MTGRSQCRLSGGLAVLASPATTRFLSFAFVLALLAVTTLAPQSFAGGVQVSARVPSETDAPRHESTALLVTVAECHNAKNLAVVGRAEGLVDGERRSVALTVRPGRDVGLFELSREWPAAGRWVLVLEVTAWDHTRTMVVDLAPSSADEPLRIEQTSATWKRVGEKEVKAALRGTMPKDSAENTSGTGNFQERVLGR